MVTPVEEPQDETRSKLPGGVRGRAFDVLLGCFAGSVGADTATLFARENGVSHLAATWARGDSERSVPRTRDGLVQRALDGGGAQVQSAIDGAGHGHTGVAAAFSSDQGVLGAIYAGFEPPSVRAHRQLVWAADSYAQLAALCMSGDATIAAVLGSSGFDALTGCLNYAGLLDALDAEIQRSKRRGHWLTCCMIDIDGFTEINERRGQIEGDRVLAAVGETLRSSTRRYDAVGRFRGNAFIIVLPETGGHSHRRIAERLQAAVRWGVAEATSVAIEASVGVVEWDGEDSATDLVSAAETTMRTAKASGRGRVDSQPSADRADGLAELTRELVRSRGSNPEG
ncbi:MAG: GGDEF domain-containing protein [Solirubrobacterales bacterium]